MDFDIEENLAKLPKKPGVYLMHAADDEIYVDLLKKVMGQNIEPQYWIWMDINDCSNHWIMARQNQECIQDYSGY